MASWADFIEKKAELSPDVTIAGTISGSVLGALIGRQIAKTARPRTSQRAWCSGRSPEEFSDLR